MHADDVKFLEEIDRRCSTAVANRAEAVKFSYEESQRFAALTCSWPWTYPPVSEVQRLLARANRYVANAVARRLGGTR